MYKKEVVDLYSNLTRIWIIPIGPYVYVKALAMALILFGPIAYLYNKQLGKKHAIIWFFLFIFSIISVQTISALFAMFNMFILYLIYHNRRIVLYFFIVVPTLIFLIYLFIPSAVIEQLNKSPDAEVCCSAVDYYFDYYIFDHPTSSINVRFMNLKILFLNWFENWKWLFGWGNGSLGDPERVVSSIFDDYVPTIIPGSFFIWFLESGIFVGMFIFFILLRAIIIGLNSHNDILIMMAISLVGYFTMMLSTINSKILGPALVICGLIEYFSRKRPLKVN